RSRPEAYQTGGREGAGCPPRSLPGSRQSSRTRPQETTRPCSSRATASQSCERRPRVIGLAVTRTRPSRTARTKLVLFSTPTTASPRAIASRAAPVQQPEPPEVRHDAREQQAPERLRRGRGEDHLPHLFSVPAHDAGDLIADQAVAHELARVDDEFLAVGELAGRHVAVVVRQREHAEGHVARFVFHHVANELLEKRLLRDLEEVAEGGHGEALDDDL